MIIKKKNTAASLGLRKCTVKLQASNGSLKDVNLKELCNISIMNILHNSFFFFVFEQLNNYNNAYIDYSFSKILFYHVRLNVSNSI